MSAWINRDKRFWQRFKESLRRRPGHTINLIKSKATTNLYKFSKNAKQNSIKTSSNKLWQVWRISKILHFSSVRNFGLLKLAVE